MEEKQYHFEIGSAEKTGRYLMYVFNGIFLVAGSALFMVAMYVQFDKDLGNHVGQLGFARYYHYSLVPLVGSILVVLTSFSGWCGTYYWNLPLLYTYVVLTVLCFAINMTGAIMMLVTGLDYTYAYIFVSETMLQRIHEYQTIMESRYTVDVVQEFVGCCGAYSWQDWTDAHLPIPDTCRDQVTGNQYRDSCALVMSRHLETLTGLLSGIALWICLLELFSLLFVMCMYRGIKERRTQAEQDFME